MTTGIQKCIQASFAVTDNEKRIAGDCETGISTGYLKPKLVGDEQPVPGKDGSTFQLVDFSCGIP